MGNCKRDRPLTLPARVLSVYIEATPGFSCVHSPDGLNSTVLSPGCILEVAPTVGIMGRKYIPRTGERVWSLRWPRSSSPVNCGSYPLNSLL